MLGRPTKYNDDILERTRAYIDQHEEQGDLVPIAAGLACWLGVSKSTVYKWAEDHPEFSDTLGEMQSKQERLLASGGLSGAYNSTITKLMLHNHGYSDKQETEHSGGVQIIGVKEDFGE